MMSPQTYQLHLMLVRMAKGAISAWEKWIRATGTEESQELPQFSGDCKQDAEAFSQASSNVMRRR